MSSPPSSLLSALLRPHGNLPLPSSSVICHPTSTSSSSSLPTDNVCSDAPPDIRSGSPRPGCHPMTQSRGRLHGSSIGSRLLHPAGPGKRGRQERNTFLERGREGDDDPVKAGADATSHVRRPVNMSVFTFFPTVPVVASHHAATALRIHPGGNEREIHKARTY